MKRAISVAPFLCFSALCASLAACGTKSTATGVTPPVDAGPSIGDAGAPDGDAGGRCKVIETVRGPIAPGTGSTDANPGATCDYKGIPYAAPPVGPLRWKAPQPAASWTTPLPSIPASGCPQTASEFGIASTNEDCLYLNVWVPAGLSSFASAPVMVFVHGGSFLYGSGTFGLYDGANLAAASGAIVVTLNYRLGALGYLSNAALRAEDPSNPSAGEYGTLDQIAAFEWVQKNIDVFGGNPEHVTIFGESAGGTSMFLHLISPKSAGLFQAMIIESGAAAGGSPAVPMAYGDDSGATFATAMGCTDPNALLSCLRAKSVTDLLANAGTEAAPNWWPVVDGVVVPDDPVTLFAAGSINKVPTMLGTNKDEGSLFVFQSPPTDDASYLAFANGIVPDQGAAIVAEYPIASFGSSYETAAIAVLTDGTFICPTRRVARAIAATNTPVFRYDFVHAMEDPPFPNLGAFHGSEMVFVFGNSIDSTFGLQADEMPLSQLMMGYWGSMATTSNPNGAGRFTWPAYDMATETDLVLDTTQATETQFKKALCDFWDGIEK